MQNSESIFQKFMLISRNIFFLIFLFILIVVFSGMFGITWLGWIESISVFLIFVSLVTPGILVLLKVPWLAQAWLRGINPFGFPATPWEQLSTGAKFSVYFSSILSSASIIIIIIVFAFRYIQK